MALTDAQRSDLRLALTLIKVVMDEHEEVRRAEQANGPRKFRTLTPSRVPS